MVEAPQRSTIDSVEDLENLLSEPTEAVIETMAALDGDLVILGVGGKMGPTLARMAERASDLAGVKRRIIGVSRFSAPSGLEQRLNAWGIETHRADLLDAQACRDCPRQPMLSTWRALSLVPRATNL